MATSILELVLANACLLAAGAGLTRAFGLWRAPGELRRALATSFLAGVAAYGVTAQLLYVFGLALTLSEALALCALLASIGLLPPLRQPVSRVGAPFRRIELAGALLVLVPLVLLAVDAAFQPLSSWDAWAQWTPKARALVLLDGLDPAVFANPAYADLHPDYPLLVPALEAFAFRFIGLQPRIVHLEFWFLLAGFAGAMLELLRARVGALLAWAAVIVILWTPAIGSETMTANADMPLAIFVALAGITTWLWVSEGSGPALCLTALFGAGALATKLEGLLEIGIVVAAGLALTLLHARRRFWPLAGAGIAALAGIVPWRLWTLAHDTPTSYPARGVIDTVTSLEASRVPISALELLHQVFLPARWLLLVPLALAALVLAGLPRRTLPAAGATAALVASGLVCAFALPDHSFEWRSAYWLLFLGAAAGGVVVAGTVVRHGGPGAFALAVIGAMFCAFVAIYLFTPYEFAWHLGTSASRVVLPIALFAAAFIPLALHRALAPADDAARQPGGGRLS